MYLAIPYQFSASEIGVLLGKIANLDLAPGPGGTRMSDERSTRFYLEEALRLHPPFRHPWLYASVVAIYPGAQIQAHRDAPITGTRLHVPLQQNPGCWSFHDGEWAQLVLGQTYGMDPSLEHGAVNWGNQVRLQLLVDIGKDLHG